MESTKETQISLRKVLSIEQQIPTLFEKLFQNLVLIWLKLWKLMREPLGHRTLLLGRCRRALLCQLDSNVFGFSIFFFPPKERKISEAE